MINETITAIATPIGWGGIGIIKITGNDTFKIISNIFRAKNITETTAIPTHRIKYGYIIDNNTQEIVDEVLVSFFRNPNSYTKEDSAEINCHGGLIVQKRILELVIKNGARLATPGEFTKRAFLNGRIDLSQAEAVVEMINSKTEVSRKASVNQLEGKLSDKIKHIRKELVQAISDIEANIDYPEYDIPEISNEKLLKQLNRVYSMINSLSKKFFEGKIIREGINIAIVGKPNVGKSSLLNAIIQKEKAIITDIPGTTRDVIEEFIQIDGIAINLLDTAGLRQTQDTVEKIGIDKTKQAIQKADLVLLVLDNSNSLEDADVEIFNLLSDKDIIIILNKSDLGNKLSANEIKVYFNNSILLEISAKQEIGIEQIEQAIKKMLESKQINLDNEIIITNLRHQQIVLDVKTELELMIESLAHSVPTDLISSSMLQATNKLGEITGDTASEEVINAIFSKFCIGK